MTTWDEYAAGFEPVITRLATARATAEAIGPGPDPDHKKAIRRLTRKMHRLVPDDTDEYEGALFRLIDEASRLEKLPYGTDAWRVTQEELRRAEGAAAEYAAGAYAYPEFRAIIARLAS